MNNREREIETKKKKRRWRLGVRILEWGKVRMDLGWSRKFEQICVTRQLKCPSEHIP